LPKIDEKELRSNFAFTPSDISKRFGELINDE
jgi:hypothetical protein